MSKDRPILKSNHAQAAPEPSGASALIKKLWKRSGSKLSLKGWIRELTVKDLEHETAQVWSKNKSK